MAQFVDVLLRGLLLVFASVAAGGVAWTGLVLRAAPHAKPEGATAMALRTTALGAGLAVTAQIAVVGLVLGELSRQADGVPLAAYLETAFARGAVDRKSTRLNSSHLGISYGVFCLKNKN